MWANLPYSTDFLSSKTDLQQIKYYLSINSPENPTSKDPNCHFRLKEKKNNTDLALLVSVSHCFCFIKQHAQRVVKEQQEFAEL